METEENKTEEDKDYLYMDFDPNTIEHLGISMYARLPPVIAELIANSYDADASEVKIELYDSDPENKSITITDDGLGMSFKDINKKFLKIGRNRRKTEGTDVTEGNRKVIGKKGIGKLSVFGVAEEVTITTVKNGIKNKFSMSLEGIKTGEKPYRPIQEIKDQSCSEENGTKIELIKLRRRSLFDTEEIAKDLANRFLIFDDSFKTKIVYNGDEGSIINVNNEYRFKDLEEEFKWKFPNEEVESEYEKKGEIVGEIYASKTPVSSSMKGIYLISRGKLVNKPEFYGSKETDYAHEYITGWLKVDFIDDYEEELISTNRESLNWEDEKTEPLREYLRKIISFVIRSWRNQRKEVKEKEIKEKTQIDIPNWIEGLNAQDRPLARKMTDAVLKNSKIDTEKSCELIKYVKDVFEFESFKNLASRLDEVEDIAEESILKLFKDWELIEAREMYKLALVRIETIKKFEKLIKDNEREKPIVHNFLSKFPWLLDPRIMNFEDEVTYSNLLKEKFKEPESTLEIDRRIDFLCVDLADTLFVIELKRPDTKANDNYLDQALDYSSFLKENKGNDPNFSKREIKTYLICGGIVNVPKVREKADAYEQSRKVYVRTYVDLLQAALNYHKEFIKKYEELNKTKTDSID